MAIEFLPTKVARVEASDVIVVATKAYVYGYLFTSTPSNIYVDDARQIQEIYIWIVSILKEEFYIIFCLRNITRHSTSMISNDTQSQSEHSIS